MNLGDLQAENRPSRRQPAATSFSAAAMVFLPGCRRQDWPVRLLVCICAYLGLWGSACMQSAHVKRGSNLSFGCTSA